MSCFANRLRFLPHAILLSALALSACSAGSGGGPTSTSPNGSHRGGNCAILVTPGVATVAAGNQQSFAASACSASGGSSSSGSTQWAVNGVVGGNAIDGTISANGLYVAPTINPGSTVTISTVNSGQNVSNGTADVTITNPPLAAFEGATYAETVASWNTHLLPWAEGIAGLTWNPATRAWTPTPGWTAPSEGIAPNIYYLEEALRPATRMAIEHQDIPLLEELAIFHAALLATRTTTIGALLENTGSGYVDFIDGSSAARTFAWLDPYNSRQVEIRDCQLCNAQYLSTATRLLRAIAQLPATSRTQPMLDFVTAYSPFLVSEQLLRMLYGSTPWAHSGDAKIPQPVVSAWSYLASTGYRTPAPNQTDSAMLDVELWLVADSAEVLMANKAAPELNILTRYESTQLQQAVTAGDALIAARCHHIVAPDGSDVLSLFAGDYDGNPDYAYAGDTTASLPTAPAPMTGLSWDISHAYRFPILFRSLYETSSATGVSFPALNDLVALANNYVHLAYNGDAQQPDFNNFIDGWNGWFGVDESDAANGYPPYEYCNAQQNPDNCLNPGGVQGWSELDAFNPTLAALSQTLISLAYDDSTITASFKDQHYYYAGQHYSANAGSYPQLMVYIAADGAERLE